MAEAEGENCTHYSQGGLRMINGMAVFEDSMNANGPESWNGLDSPPAAERETFEAFMRLALF